MSRKNARLWLVILSALALGVFWVMTGGSLLRRWLFSPTTVAEKDRSSACFLAVVLPKITLGPQPYTMTQTDLAALLKGMRKLGYVTVGADEVRDFYVKGRLLPPKAVLLGFDRDHPESVRLADAVLKRQRMRAVVFLNKTRGPAGAGFRHSLSDHALAQLRRSGAWDLGASAEEDPGVLEPTIAAVIDSGKQNWTRNASRYPLRVVEAKTGYNDLAQRLSDLRVLRLRGERPPQDNLRIVEAMWPRAHEFIDTFAHQGLGLDWTADWGVVSAGNGRLALIPTPRQTSASVFLTGTENWRDAVIEFEVRKSRRAFWAYLRSSGGDRFVRVGLREGSWLVQQKTGAGRLPVTLGRAPVLPGSLPARVRLIVKDQWAIVHVNGRLQFGKGLRLHPNIHHGRFQLGVFDEKPKSALTVLGWVRASPLAHRWLALDLTQAPAVLEESYLERLRQQALFARAISPRWLALGAGGAVLVAAAHRDFVQNLAGFNRCLLVPMLDLGDCGSLAGEPAVLDRLVQGLASATEELDADGLNIRLKASAVSEPQIASFLASLRRRLKAEGRRLWLTLDDWDGTLLRLGADGVLRALPRKPAGLESFEEV